MRSQKEAMVHPHLLLILLDPELRSRHELSTALHLYEKEETVLKPNCVLTALSTAAKLAPFLLQPTEEHGWPSPECLC